MEAIKLSEVSDNGGMFRWSPGGPAWKRIGVLVRCVESPTHTVSAPNWDATVWEA